LHFSCRSNNKKCLNSSNELFRQVVAKAIKSGLKIERRKKIKGEFEMRERDDTEKVEEERSEGTQEKLLIECHVNQTKIARGGNFFKIIFSLLKI
jgi:hypothetical protein